MRRIHLFLLLTAISIAVLIGVTVAGYFVLSTASATGNGQYSQNWMGQMWQGMGGMMGTNGAAQAATQNAAAPYLGIAFILSVAIAILGIAGIVYFAVFPEIRNYHATPQPPQIINTRPAPTAAVQTAVPVAEATVSPYESVLKTLTVDERKVIQVLKGHGGKYLQKYIRNEVGLSRLQTHRILARMAERGIVSLERTGNTNTVLLASWLQ